ncbi:hypothetical protein [uncultured Tateyamaria sp.]|uniref:hypothetical protein n=1 Tax=uncultured Tateyamaria sp. TaxID=455651 RepID=UPI00262AE32E|nr:hypothetical protein [uncultured Tateyamaria sp.]
MKRLFLACAVAMGLGAPVSALDLVCNVKDTGDGFISPVIVFRFPDGGGSPEVFDVFIEETKGAPIPLRVRQRNDGRYVLTWRVSNLPARPRPATIGYRAVLNEARTQVTISGSIRGVLNSINGRGQCQPGQLNQ